MIRPRNGYKWKENKMKTEQDVWRRLADAEELEPAEYLEAFEIVYGRPWDPRWDDSAPADHVWAGAPEWVERGRND